MADWKIFTYEGTDLNDGSKYESWFPAGTVMSTGTTKVKLAKRANAAPQISSNTPQERSLQIFIKMLPGATLESRRDVLATLFDISDRSRTLKTLIAKDASDTDKQWYLEVKPINLAFLTSVVVVTFTVPDWRWFENDEQTETKTNPAHDATFTVTPNGNIPTDPVIKIGPTAVRSGIVKNGHRFRRFIEVTNVMDRTTLLGHSINLMDSESGGGYDTASDISFSTNSVAIDNVSDITDSATEIDYDTEVGTMPSVGVGYVDTEQISWTGKSGTQLTGVLRGLGGTTPAAHLNDAVITESLMMVDGDDIEIHVDGQIVDRYLADMNGADTKIWIVGDWKRKIEFTLRSDIASSGGINNIRFREKRSDIREFKRLPNSGILKIGNEYFTYTSKSLDRFRVSGVAREVFGTAEAAHTAGDTITFIEKEIWMFYGNNADDPPNTSDAADHQPVINLSTSTNTSHVYADFGTNLKTRAQEWAEDVTNVQPSGAHNNDGVRTYTANRDTIADPASEMGIRIQSVLYGTQFAQTWARVSWAIYNPVGITDVNVTGEKFVTGPSWPQLAAMQFSTLGDWWKSEFTEAKPSVDSTWENLANNGANALGATYRYLRFLFDGGVDGGAAIQIARMEIADLTLTLDGANEPATSVGDQNSFGGSADTKDTYQILALFTNQTTGEILGVNATMEVDQTLVIDCRDKKCYVEENNQPMLNAIIFIGGPRSRWFKLNSGQNTILLEDLGLGNQAIDWVFRGRHD